MSNKFISGPRGIEALAAGLDRAARVAALTYGPHGGTVAVLRSGGRLTVTGDGSTLARELAEKGALGLGVSLGRGASDSTEKGSGDGTSTALILSSALVRYALRLSGSATPLEIASDIEKTVLEALGLLNSWTRPVDRALLDRVALLAARGEEVVAQSVVQAVDEVGEGGTVLLASGLGLGVELELRSGLVLEEGWAGAHGGPENGDPERVWEGPLVAVAAVPLTSFSTIQSLLEESSQWPGRGVVVFAPSVRGEALGTLNLNVRKGVLDAAAVSYTGSPGEMDDWLADLAALTGARVVDPGAGDSLEEFHSEWLGSARRIKVTADSTTLWGYEDPEAAERRAARADLLFKRAESASGDHERDRLRGRAANLTGGLATLKIGGVTSHEAQERRARAEDCLHSVQSALGSGVLPGAGAALARAARELSSDTPGARAVQAALRAPRGVLARRARTTGSWVQYRDPGNPDPWVGWDPLTDQWRDLGREPAVVDSAAVVAGALRSALSVALGVLRCGGLVVRGK